MPINYQNAVEEAREELRRRHLRAELDQLRGQSERSQETSQSELSATGERELIIEALTPTDWGTGSSSSSSSSSISINNEPISILDRRGFHDTTGRAYFTPSAFFKKKKGNTKFKNPKGKVIKLISNYQYKDVSLEKGSKAMVVSSYGKGVTVDVMNSKKEMVKIPIPFSKIKVLENEKSIIKEKIPPWVVTQEVDLNLNTPPGTPLGNSNLVWSDHPYRVVISVGPRFMKRSSCGRYIMDMDTGFACSMSSNWQMDSYRSNILETTVNNYFNRVLN